MLKSVAKEAFRSAGLHLGKLQSQPWGVEKFVDALSLCPDARVIFDVGANVGQSVASLRDLNRSADIYAFEPVPSSYDKLRAMVDRHPRTRAVNLAMGDRIGLAPMTIEPLNEANTLLTGSWPDFPTQMVPVTTVDDYCAKEGISQIDLLKIDVEGYESQVLEGAKDMLTKGAVRLVLAECEFSGSAHGDFDDIRRRCEAAGLKLVAMYTGGVGENGWAWGDVLFMAPQPGRPLSCSPYA